MAKLPICLVMLASLTAAFAAPAPSPATKPATRATTRPMPVLEPSATPSEALQHWYEAIAARDEQAVAKRALVESPTGYCEAFAQVASVSTRLEELTRKKKIDRGPKHDQFLNAGYVRKTPTKDEVDTLYRPMIAKMEWKTAGDTATPVDPRLAGSDYGQWTARKINGGWILVLGDPTLRAPPKEIEQHTRELIASRAAMEDAISRVNAGTFQSISEINDFLKAEYAKAKDATKKN